MLVIKCPHCNQTIIIEEKDINCAIFRHGVYKSNFKGINPHLCKEKCEELVRENKIYGCGKPFKLEDKQPVICDYI